jgi:hypothetical protein
VIPHLGRGLAAGATARSPAGAVRGPPPGPEVGAARAERGAAVVELLVVFLSLLVPLVYAMVVMADVQRALLATSSAAREAGRMYVTGSDRSHAERRAALAYREVLATYGMRAGDPGAGMRLEAGCPAGAGSGPGVEPAPGPVPGPGSVPRSGSGPGPGPASRVGPGYGFGSGLTVGAGSGSGVGCSGGFGPGAEVRVVVTYRVPVARLPFLGPVGGPGVTVGATHHTRVDRYRGLGG